MLIKLLLFMYKQLKHVSVLKTLFSLKVKTYVFKCIFLWNTEMIYNVTKYRSINAFSILQWRVCAYIILHGKVFNPTCNQLSSNDVMLGVLCILTRLLEDHITTIALMIGCTHTRVNGKTCFQIYPDSLIASVHLIPVCAIDLKNCL